MCIQFRVVASFPTHKQAQIYPIMLGDFIMRFTLLEIMYFTLEIQFYKCLTHIVGLIYMGEVQGSSITNLTHFENEF